jgi:hypothetical protein
MNEENVRFSICELIRENSKQFLRTSLLIINSLPCRFLGYAPSAGGTVESNPKIQTHRSENPLPGLFEETISEPVAGRHVEILYARPVSGEKTDVVVSTVCSCGWEEKNIRLPASFTIGLLNLIGERISNVASSGI